MDHEAVSKAACSSVSLDEDQGMSTLQMAIKESAGANQAIQKASD
jgi:hypothetical protein